MRSLDELEPLVPNEDRFPADYIEIIRDQLGRGFEGEEVFVDGHNVVVSQGLPTTEVRRQRWGKLDGVLDAGGTQTVSLWQKTGGGWDGWDEDSGEDQEAVYAPPTWGNYDRLGEAELVLIEKINRRWIVVFPTPKGRWGKLDEDLGAGGSATVSLWEGVSGEPHKAEKDSGDNVTAYAPAVLPTGTLPGTSFVFVSYWVDRWIVMLADCT